MLTELRLENYAVIDSVVVEFGPGLNLKRSRLQDQLSKRVKRSDVDVRACGKRTVNALCAVNTNRRGRHDGSEGKR